MNNESGQTADTSSGSPGELVRLIAQGNLQAEAKLVAHFSPILMKILMRRTNQDRQRAEDAHQETFRIMLEKLRAQPLGEPDKIAGYLHGIANRVLIGEFRKESRRATYADSDTIAQHSDHRPGPQATFEQEEVSRSVRALISQLPTERDRRVLYEYHVLDRDKARICDALDLTPRHFDRVISRARKRLRELLIQQRSAE